MTLTLRILGLEILYLDLTTDPPEAEAEADEHAMPSGGATGSQPVGFVARFDVPDMVPAPNRPDGWGDE